MAGNCHIDGLMLVGRQMHFAMLAAMMGGLVVLASGISLDDLNAILDLIRLKWVPFGKKHG